jgi:hypothetical protein
LVTIREGSGVRNVTVDGVAPDTVHGQLPDREKLLRWLESNGATLALLDYARSTVVVPAFSLDVAEAFVKTVIRQVISARQARRLIAEFVRQFGHHRDGAYGFPHPEEVLARTDGELAGAGLGMKAGTIRRGLQALMDLGEDALLAVRGVGPWTRSVLTVEGRRSFAYYPFHDKSGVAVRDHCGLGLCQLASKNPANVGAAYFYAASFLESQR